MWPKASGLLLLALLAGCSTEFLMDPKGSKTPANYHADLMECERIVDKRHSVGWGATKGATVGLLSGAGLTYGAQKLGHVGGGNQAIAVAAIGGAIFGGLLSGLTANGTNQTFVKKCLEGRGYSILE